MTAPQSAKLCKDFSARCAAPEPSERRATKGFCKRTIFTRKTSGRLSSSEDRLILCYSFFEISRYHLRSEKMCDERLLRCLKLLPSGAKRHLSKSCRYRNRKNTFCDYCCTLFYGVKPLYHAFLDVPLRAFLAYKFSDNRGENESK